MEISGVSSELTEQEATDIWGLKIIVFWALTLWAQFDHLYIVTPTLIFNRN